MARYFQNTVGLSTQALLMMIDVCTMRNSPINREAVKTAQDIWGLVLHT